MVCMRVSVHSISFDRGITYGDKDCMARRTFILQPLTKAANGNTRCLPDSRIRIGEAGLDNGPNLIQEWCYEFTATLDRNTQGKNRSATFGRLRCSEVLEDKVAQSGKDLCWG